MHSERSTSAQRYAPLFLPYQGSKNNRGSAFDAFDDPRARTPPPVFTNTPALHSMNHLGSNRGAQPHTVLWELTPDQDQPISVLKRSTVRKALVSDRLS
jgi:hypothetical protein